LKQQGVDESLVLLEAESVDTIGNAVLVAARYLRGMTPGTLYVVTSPFHLQRATLSFRFVLGEDWDVQGVGSEPAADDAVRATTEKGGIDWMDRTFAGITPGDLPSIIARLSEVRESYASLAWLHQKPESTQAVA